MTPVDAMLIVLAFPVFIAALVQIVDRFSDR
jgi:hypothetical protein